MTRYLIVDFDRAQTAVNSSLYAPEYMREHVYGNYVLDAETNAIVFNDYPFEDQSYSRNLAKLVTLLNEHANDKRRYKIVGFKEANQAPNGSLYAPDWELGENSLQQFLLDTKTGRIIHGDQPIEDQTLARSLGSIITLLNSYI